MPYDVIVIGGGPSGLMACIASSANGAKTLLVDKGDRLGRKLGISGGGRCNVTNAKELDELIRHIPGNGRFLHSALATFSNTDIIAFFEGMGIRLKEEDRGRMFPVSDKAKTVVDALIGRVRQQGVDIRTNSPVARVLYENGKTAGIVLKSGERIASRCVVIATGGKSVPHTGSTGDGYPWAEDAGHTITDLYPTEVPITSNEPFIRSKALQGLSLRDIELTVWNDKGKKLVTHEGDMIFTHFGISGPAVLRCSQFVVKALRQAKTQAKQNTAGGSPSTKTVNTVLLTVDLFPGRSPDTIAEETLRLAKQEPKKQVKNVLRGYVSERLLPILFDMSKLPEELTFDNIPKLPWVELAKLMKQLPIHVNGTLSIEEAFVTGGGINLKEIDPKSMESKLVSGLFFCGEILDVHGYTGGYNITAAFTTGYSAGKSSAERSAEQLLQ